MSEMVEQVARAIYEGGRWSLRSRRIATSAAWEDLSEDRRRAWFAAARAAIEAMREPSDYVADQGLGTALDTSWLMDDRLTPYGDGRVTLSDDFVIVSDVNAIWKSMIDAALTSQVP